MKVGKMGKVGKLGKMGKVDKVGKTLILFQSGGANYAYQITAHPTPSRFLNLSTAFIKEWQRLQ